MPRQAVGFAAAIATLVGGVLAVALLVWPGPRGDDPHPGPTASGNHVDVEPVYPGDPGQVVEFGDMAVVRPQDWSSWTLYGGRSGPGLQIVSHAARDPGSVGEADPIKAMAGDEVAVTLIPTGRNDRRNDIVTITRADLATRGAEVPVGRAIVDRHVCRSGPCVLLHVEFATRRPSDQLLRQVNRLLATIQPIRS